MGFFKSIGKAVKKIAPVAIRAGAAYLTGGTSEAALAGSSGGSSIANLVNGAVGLGQDYLQNQYNLHQQKKLSDYEFQQNLKMWNMVNAYNDPEAQMKRLVNAGLNPNLVYGGGNVTGNTSSSAPTYDAGDYKPVDKSIQREQLRLAMEEHQQRITNQAIENELARERIGLAERDADRQDRLADAQIQAYRANLGLASERNDLTKENNSLLAQNRADRLAQVKFKSAHDDYLKRLNNLANSAMYKFASDREKYQLRVKYGLGREPQLKDFY